MNIKNNNLKCFDIILSVFVSKSEFNFISNFPQSNIWKHFSVSVSQKLCIFSGLKFIVNEPFYCFCVSVHCDSHKIIFFEFISLVYVFRIFLTMWKTTNTMIFIRLIFCIIFVIEDSDPNCIFLLNYFHFESELNIENNLLEKCENRIILIYFCECFPIEIEIILIYLISAFLQ